MGMSRGERNALHKKQERALTGTGVPSMDELVEGVPVLRSTAEGLVEYVRYNSTLYKKVFDKG